ncbi:MAG: hypothetical protein KKF46_03910, partial [Nanoarchaeota archaeon]|nr:hypothetical protein [Nanoarchaeota archaeon]MBU1597312.1 hypothetical protein [Nanoarchaeota archaeon]MBU2441445.1 hypothetical protein [Nanoarchaeota archaeon]
TNKYLISKFPKESIPDGIILVHPTKNLIKRLERERKIIDRYLKNERNKTFKKIAWNTNY